MTDRRDDGADHVSAGADPVGDDADPVGDDPDPAGDDADLADPEGTARRLLSELAADRELPFDPDTVQIDDAGVLGGLSPAVRRWWVEAFGEYVAENGGLFTPPQREAIPHIDAGRNLDAPLSGIAERIAAATGEEPTVRQAIRHGDTSDADRAAMLDETPHVLNTTPETLAILLNAPKFREKLRTVEYVIVDEIHSLAGNKRGTHLAVSLERLTELADGSPTRVGCSATVEPLDGMAEFLVGRERATGAVGDPDGFVPREYEVVDTRFVREFDLELRTPAADLVNTPTSVVTDRFYDDLHDLVEDHTNTLVFTNSRSGAERVLQGLRERFDYDESDSGCHHGSLGEGQRSRIESGMKSGDLDVVRSGRRSRSRRSSSGSAARVTAPAKPSKAACSRSTATNSSSVRRCSREPRTGSSTACPSPRTPPTSPPSTCTGWR